MSNRNIYHQPIGVPVENWTPRPFPDALSFEGKYCRLERLDAACHAAELYAAFSAAPDGRDWTYITEGPFADVSAYTEYLKKTTAAAGAMHYAILDAETKKPAGSIALLRIDPDQGVVEIGALAYSGRLRRSRAGTEAVFLLLQHIFDELGYRRCEWKCDSLNAPSRQAAERYGFVYEGIFRQASVYKGRNRDTAWFSMTGDEWPARRQAFQKWLLRENFDENGTQFRSLSTVRMQHEPLTGFKKLGPEDRALFNKIFSAHPQRISCYTFSTLFAWNLVYRYEWAMTGSGALLISFQPPGENVRYFFQPLGNFDPAAAAQVLKLFRQIAAPVTIYNVGREFIDRHPAFVSFFDVQDDRDCANYIYGAEAFAALAGKEYATKRAMIAQAKKLHTWTSHPLTAENIPECLDILEAWNARRDAENDGRDNEVYATRTALDNFTALGLQGILIKIDGIPAAFSIFSRLNPEMAALNFWKADSSYKGIYEVSYQETAKAIASAGYSLINLEEDLGIPGLRQNKMSYRPSKLVPSYTLTLKG